MGTGAWIAACWIVCGFVPAMFAAQRCSDVEQETWEAVFRFGKRPESVVECLLVVPVWRNVIRERRNRVRP